MYHTINTLHPKKEQRNTALALTFTLLGLVVAGYLMIGLITIIAHYQSVFYNNCIIK